MKHTGSNILSPFDLKIHRMGIISTFLRRSIGTIYEPTHIT